MSPLGVREAEPLSIKMNPGNMMWAWSESARVTLGKLFGTPEPQFPYL